MDPDQTASQRSSLILLHTVCFRDVLNGQAEDTADNIFAAEVIIWDSLAPITYGPSREKYCLRWFVNNKDADQPAHSHRLIRAFVIRLLESIIP